MLDSVTDIAVRGPLTPDHVIRTKRIPLVVNDDDITGSVSAYSRAYDDYFHRNTNGQLTRLDPAPRWAVWRGQGVVAFGGSVKESRIVADINRHTVRCIQWGELLGGWQALSAKDIFDVEYWELEQAKLNKGGTSPSLQGHVALVTGAASGIGQACVESLLKRGAAVIAVDIDPKIEHMYERAEVVGLICDVRDGPALLECVRSGVLSFGGLDIVISNAGIFPATQSIADMEDETWTMSLELNLSSHQRLLRYCIPFLQHGVDPAVVIIGSKNVPAPGPGASGDGTAAG